MYLDLNSPRCWCVIMLVLILGSFLCATALDSTPQSSEGMRVWFGAASIVFAIGAAIIAVVIPIAMQETERRRDD